MISRKVNSSKSILANMLYNVTKIITQFIFRSIFIHFLSVEYLGMNSAITNVLSLLSITELGLTSVVVVNLYKPIADNDLDKVNSIVFFYRKVFAIIGILVFCLGIFLLPFIDKIVSISGDLYINLKLVYFLYLFSSSLSYFFSYRNILFIAYQELYKSCILNTIMAVLSFILQIMAVIIFKNYYAYLIVTIISNILNYFLTYVQSIKAYPFVTIRKRVPLDNETKISIKINLKGMIYHKFSSVVLQASDSILISAFIGTLTLGIYSNYTLFTTNLILIFSVISTSLAGSIGSLLIENNAEKSYRIYQDLKFVFYWIAGFCSICLFILLNPAINLWAKFANWDNSTSWTFDTFTILIIVVEFYIHASRIITGTFRECFGNFNKDRFKGIIEAVINLIVSLLLIKPLGIAGVLIGTIVSCLCTSIWVDPLMIYKYSFKKSIKLHLRDITLYTIVVAVVGFFTCLLSSFVVGDGFGSFILKLIICAIVPNVLFLIIYCKTPMLKDLFKFLKSAALKIKAKQNKINNTIIGNAVIKTTEALEENVNVLESDGDNMDCVDANVKNSKTSNTDKTVTRIDKQFD